MNKSEEREAQKATRERKLRPQSQDVHDGTSRDESNEAAEDLLPAFCFLVDLTCKEKFIRTLVDRMLRRVSGFNRSSATMC